jgi:TRAP-type C4-dicarboxylate transport system permease small subunit|tara:strand:+ start:2867 stop:3256 length:390 start_codon:yes stop_codon:yes gene_type:complete
VEDDVLTKILVTILVILGAIVYLRRGRGHKVNRIADMADAQKSPLLSRVIIYTMIAVSMLASAGYWGWSWYDDNTVVEVTITSPIEAMTNSYKVRKKDIEAQRITTVDGIQIRLSNQERLTIKTTNSPQ